jgi:hypothetical protein
VKKAESASGETESMLEEGGEHHDFIGVGSRNVFIFCRLPLEDGTGGEKMILDEF